MASDYDALYEEYMRQFLQRNDAQAQRYQQAARYLAARRLMHDSAERNKPPISLLNRLRRLLHRPSQHTPTDVIEGEVVWRSDDSSTENASDNPPIVIIIPPATDNHH